MRVDEQVGWPCILSAEDDREVDVLMSAEEWESKKVIALERKADCARSRGNRELKTMQFQVS